MPAQTGEDARLGIANLIYPCLLVLDNADDPDVDYQQYFPSKTLGVVMLTSRNDECQQYATTKSIALEGLCDREAQELLLKVARVPEDQYHVHGEDAKLVAGLLQSHPLTLVQAGAYVSRGHCTLADYPRVYKRQRQRLLAFRSSQAQSRYRDVYATFEVSAAMLTTSKTETGRDALQLLSLLAVCASSRLPLPLFEAAWQGTKRVPPDMDDEAEDDDVLLLTPWHVRHIPSLLDIDSDTWDSFRLVEAVSLLKAFSLVLTDSYDGSLSVSMHPLVHAWARDRQGDTEQYQNWLQMGCVAALAHSEGSLWQIHGRQLQSHIEALTAWEVANMFGVESPMLVTRVLVHCGWLLHTMRADVTLFVLMRKIFVRLKLDPSKCKRPWMGVYDLAAGNLINSGKAKEAVALLQEVMKIREQSLAEDHPSRLASQHTLAGAYQANGQVKEAVILLKEVVRIREQSLVEDHPSRLASQHALAGAYEANGHVKEAVTLLKEVVRIEEQSLAEDHPSRLASQHALAGAYKANGQVKEAVILLKEVVRIREQSLAEDHPSRLASQHTLAGAYKANGQVKEAVILLKEVVRIREQSLVEDHPSRLASQHTLAGAYKANGQVKEAVTLLEEVVRIKEQSLAEDHPDRLASQHNLAICMWELGNHKASLSMMALIVELQRKVLDKSHPDRQISEDWLDYFQQEMAELEPI
jgi:tetratricopeptide (TPR) repeat protein